MPTKEHHIEHYYESSVKTHILASYRLFKLELAYKTGCINNPTRVETG